MTDPIQEPAAMPEEKSKLSTLAVQLVVIPLLVVMFCVGLGALFVWMTSERKDMTDYMAALRGSSGEKRSQQAQFLLNYIQESKRWQGIFDMTARMTADRDEFLEKHPQALNELVGIFEDSAGTDPKTRRYLALVMGLLGDKGAAPALMKGLNDADAETVKNCAWALGVLGDTKAAPKLIELAGHDESSVRMTVVYVLGILDYPPGKETLVASLKDRDELVQWNAAFALARKGDAAGRDVLVRLLDRSYVDKFTTIMPQNRQRYRVAAVQALVKLDNTGALEMLKEVSEKDSDLQVRNAAIQELNRLKEPSP